MVKCCHYHEKIIIVIFIIFANLLARLFVLGSWSYDSYGCLLLQYHLTSYSWNYNNRVCITFSDLEHRRLLRWSMLKRWRPNFTTFPKLNNKNTMPDEWFFYHTMNGSCLLPLYNPPSIPFWGKNILYQKIIRKFSWFDNHHHPELSWKMPISIAFYFYFDSIGNSTFWLH